jgi:hypothetical protein
MRSMSLRRYSLLALLTAALVVAAIQSAAQAGTSQIVDHKFFPLVPGTTFKYTAPGKTITVKVLNKTKVIQGHESQEVRTREREGGNVTEEFHDWYFQGSGGTVWYMKHTDRTHPDENWEAGKDSAKRGTYLPADPKEGDTWKRTRAPHAGREGRDQAVAYGVSDKNLKIKVSSYANLYPETVRFYYKAGTGLVMIKDKDETTKLKSVSGP